MNEGNGNNNQESEIQAALNESKISENMTNKAQAQSCQTEAEQNSQLVYKSD